MSEQRSDRLVSTFSIIGRDARTGDLGIAVQSKFLGVGAVVPWVKAGVGAIATQAWANTSYGPRGLDLLAQGRTAEEALHALTEADEQSEHRQAGIVDAQGRSATFTGASCYAWAGGVAGPDFAAQGNILVSGETVRALAETFQQTPGTLWHRLLTALAAGQAAGGDSRGMQSAALVVARAGGGYGGYNDRFIDLRVDDHPSPIQELVRLLAMYELYFFKPASEDLLPLDAPLTTELQSLLTRSGDYQGQATGAWDDATYQALERYGARENLEERLAHDPANATIDRNVIEYMRAHIQ
ncbi:MAG TPA: DUF1028 domain-containing protein [Ktedonobacterales bacterium]|jgi:uncharacterized Ntn-hydrolase superfamily protein|nr:DUF1028 domain-containing protein [Ktedonobacterales bacterium]